MKVTTIHENHTFQCPVCKYNILHKMSSNVDVIEEVISILPSGREIINIKSTANGKNILYVCGHCTTLIASGYGELAQKINAKNSNIIALLSVNFKKQIQITISELSSALSQFEISGNSELVWEKVNKLQQLSSECSEGPINV